MQWRAIKGSVGARDFASEGIETLASRLRVKVEPATKRASSTRSDGKVCTPRPLPMASSGSPRRGNLKSSQRIKFREAPRAPGRRRDGRRRRRGKRAPGARLGREVVGRELGHLLRHDAAAGLRLVGLVDGVPRRGRSARVGSSCAMPRRGDGQQRREGKQQDAAKRALKSAHAL